MRITKKAINVAIANAPSSLDKASIRAMDSLFLGSYTPKDANWSYELHVISVDNKPILVASRFGHIIANGE